MPDLLGIQEPLPPRSAGHELLRCMARTARLLWSRTTHLPPERVGIRLQFADGTSARVFRETTVDDVASNDPCLLVVKFHLRLLHGRWHRIFLRECILNTPLFLGFPGFVSKLWLDRDAHDNYRGLYEWSDPARAERYARSLWRVLDLVCVRGSVAYVIVPGIRRADVFDDPAALAAFDVSGDAWWRLVESKASGTRTPAVAAAMP